MRRYAQITRKDAAAVVNRAGKQLAYYAGTYTHKARGEAIAAKLREQYATNITTPTGRRSKNPKALYRATTVGLVHMMIRMRKGTLFYKGFPNATNPHQYSRGELAALALRYVNRRIASAAFIASGWKPAWDAFSRAYTGSIGQTAKWRKAAGIGGARVATPSDKVTAELWNASVTPDKGSSEALLRYGSAGLNAGIRWVTKDMRDYLERLLQKRAAQFNKGSIAG